MDADYEEGLLKGLGRIEHLGVITWQDQTTNRLAVAGIGVGFGFVLGGIFNLIFPTKVSRGWNLALAAGYAGVGVASALLPVEGKFFDKLSTVGGVLAGNRLAAAAMA